ncbi:TPA: hypothetical protein ACGOY0_001155 [Streptococcus suis]
MKNATVNYSNDTSRSRIDAERRLNDKFYKLVNNIQYQYTSPRFNTFGQLKQNLLEIWSASVKPQTVKREYHSNFDIKCIREGKKKILGMKWFGKISLN